MSYRHYFLRALIILISLHVGQLKAQSNIDSLKLELTKDHPDSMQVAIYVDLSWEYFFDDIDLAKSYSDSAYVIASKSKDNINIGTALKSIGFYHRVKGETKEAIKYYEEALAAYPFREDSMLIKNCFYNLGVLYFDLGDFEKAIDFILIDLRISQKNDLQGEICDSYNTLGNIFSGLHNYTKAEEYFLQSNQCAVNVKDTSSMAIATGNLQSMYLRMKEYDKAFEFGEKALELETALQNKAGIGFCNYLFGYTYAELGQYEKALEKGLISLPLLESSFQETYGNANQIVGRSLLHLGRHQESLNYLKKAEDIARIGDFLELQGLVVTDLSLLYEKINRDDLALTYARKRQVLSDSMFTKEKVTAVNRIDALYQSAQKDNQLIRQSLTIEKQRTEKQHMLGLFSLFSLLLLSGLTILFYRNKKNKIISLKEAAIQSQKITELKKEKKILSMSRMLEGQESERKRIAQDLHDGLGGLLSTIKVKFGIIQKELAELESIDVYEQTSTMIDDACTEVRKIAHNMMPESLTQLGLVESIRDIAEYTTNLNIKVINLGLHKLSETQEIMLYRVIQEFLNNTRKHAMATEVIIQFSTDEKNTIIYLEDNGQGFDPSDLNKDRGLGLRSMESRINFLNGTFDLDSVTGVGTTLQIHIPKS